MPTSTSRDRELVRALGAEAEPGMRKLIVGMLTIDAWEPEVAPDIDLSARARAARRWRALTEPEPEVEAEAAS